MRPSRATRFITVLAGGALTASPAAVLVASSAPASAATDPSLSGTASSMWQTNNEVDTLVVSGGVIYAGGKFTRVRPPGSAAGSNETARSYLAAFDASTGALITSFNPGPNNRVSDLAVSPDGSRLYVAGSFTSIGGQTRNRLAAVSTATGAVDTTFNPNANKTVTAVTATASTVYLSGDFTTVRGTARANIASVNATTGALNTGFTPTFVQRPNQPCTAGSNGCPASGVITYSPRANAMRVSPDGTRLLVGGNFMGVNGNSQGGMASLDPTTGAPQAWPANTSQPINTNCAGRVTDIAISGSQAFVTGEGDPPGCYEGTYAADLSSGQVQWNASCLGASQGLAVMDGMLLKASHQHDCAFTEGGDFGGFVGGTNRDRFVHRYLVGQDVGNGAFVHWNPNTNAAMTTSVGPHTIASDGSTVVVVGGDFTKVNGANQQGLTRFVDGGDTATPLVPGRNINADPWPNTPVQVGQQLQVRVVPTAANTLTVEVPAVEDYDSGVLTYRIYRDGSSTAFAIQTAESFPWSRPVLRFDDRNLTAGTSHTYRVDARDSAGHTSAKSAATSAVQVGGAPVALDASYAALSPLAWWRLDGAAPTADETGNGHTAAPQGGVTTGQPGAVTGNGAVTLDGSSGYLTSSNTISAPGAYSEAAWFKTTSTRGGVILAQSDQQSGAGGNTDRMITMDNNGGLVFAMKVNAPASPFGTPTINFRNQGPVWNDGTWHHVVGTYDGNGTASLYVDGALQGTATGTPFDATAKAAGLATSYLRAGYADVSRMQVVFGINFYRQHWPASEFLAGSVDEVTAFDRALTLPEVQQMFAAGVAGGA